MRPKRRLEPLPEKHPVLNLRIRRWDDPNRVRARYTIVSSNIIVRVRLYTRSGYVYTESAGLFRG